MGVYCNSDDVKSEFKQLTVSDTAPITEALLTEWIKQESDHINGRIGVRYLTDSISEGSTPEAYSILKRICVFRVSERVKNKLEVKTGVTQKESEEKYEKNFVTTPNHDLDLIVKGTLLLNGVTLKSSQLGVSSFNTSSGYCNKFDVNKQQW